MTPCTASIARETGGTAFDRLGMARAFVDVEDQDVEAHDFAIIAAREYSGFPPATTAVAVVHVHVRDDRFHRPARVR